MGQTLSSRPPGRSEEQDPEASPVKDVLPTHNAALRPRQKTFDVKEDVSACEDDNGKLSKKQKRRIREWGDAIQPHTDEGGDAYYIGDVYEPAKCAHEWKVPNPGRYLRFIKHTSKSLPHLEYLAHWMEVTCAPPKWKFVKANPRSRSERAERTKACVVDYGIHEQPRLNHCNSVFELQSALKASPPEADVPKARLIVVEDLCRDLVEYLGSHYSVDPLFFLSHIGDYLFHTTRDRWVELPNLDMDMRKQSHFNLQYLRPRYFKTEESFQQAERQSGTFNVLRRLDSDRSRKRLQNMALDRPEGSVTLTRAKTSLWVKPKKEGEPVIAILIVDPTVSEGHPLWGGYRPFQETPSFADWKEGLDEEVAGPPPPTASLYEHVLYWCSQVSPEEYMTTMLGLIEWGFEKPHWSEDPSDIEELVKKFSPWRRNIGYYQTMISDAIARLFPPALKAQLDPMQQPSPPQLLNPPTPAYDETGILSLWTDFKNIKQQMTDSQNRINSIQTMAGNVINTEEARRAVRQNKNLARLTFLATIFIPLNFTTSFLSMSADFGSSPGAIKTIWLFFAIGVPIMMLALLIVDLTHPERDRSLCRRHWHNIHVKIFGQPKEVDDEVPSPGIGKKNKTIPWPYRTQTSYTKDAKK
ncbi:hypothetical protein AC578_6127 [Pseudocercospora eumusae]|uniref:Uncharacterized protein n=1 Tax=Pseudocercospora eumusae TaxID=321146 RepID=A0A139GXS6_9PEZI|nr:hypothetical protein AC578_6127 [Pseudocercospora eumusae]KXS94953.1 hypothetical protein AC578_6127 [Pseudocercospora eumusae]